MSVSDRFQSYLHAMSRATNRVEYWTPSSIQILWMRKFVWSQKFQNTTWETVPSLISSSWRSSYWIHYGTSTPAYQLVCEVDSSSSIIIIKLSMEKLESKNNIAHLWLKPKWLARILWSRGYNFQIYPPSPEKGRIMKRLCDIITIIQDAWNFSQS